MDSVDEPRIDTTRPSIARVYDAFVGGKDNFEVDREVYRTLLDVAPEAAEVGRQCRAWLIRVVRFLSGQAGIDQFLDLGSGLPTAENTHQAAQRLNPDAHVVYVDNDPAVAAHGRALLEENDRTHFAVADLREPERILAHQAVVRNIDLSRPVGLIQCNTLHHVTDEDDPAGIMQRYLAALAPGSFAAISHLHNPGDGSEQADLAEESQRRFNAMMGSCFYRGHAEIRAMFGDLEMIDPGLTHLHAWWPDGPQLGPPSTGDHLLLGGVGRKN
ncbi:SAM-dependent methyltransferase [Saccharopolyspora sp. HNM0983]|uniref:SAM-dependent methyltransferase n=1 Tax=Saccharopolyspora montiporae TaxID=2781240 RepID=A0A929B6A7_9PSEU|nr:SAM-dependent methyltransferase [Saccharopolyspora sp. HNM0983]MBE9373969.1 SAM-dependent methyltransferase [Saccharopolyspora sp. HNM0983]